MKDVQSEPGNVEIDINKVGINNLSIPLIIADKEHSEQSTIAKINMYVNLPKQYKGIHMSRFLEIIYAYTARVYYPETGLHHESGLHSFHTSFGVL